MTDSSTEREGGASGETVLFACLAEYADLAEAGKDPHAEDFRDRLGPHYERFCRMLEMEGVLGRTVDPTADVRLPKVGRDRYSEFRPVGEGGMGLVYWAIDNTLNREVAFKVIKPQGQAATQESPTAPFDFESPPSGTPASAMFDTLKQRFLQEAWVTSGMTHPGVVPVYELGETPQGVPYYTMRFVRGERTFADAIREARDKGIDERLALLEPFLRICDTVRYAHSKGVIHRDLKPQNVALGEFGEVVVLDWGLAKFEEEQDLTESVWQERLHEYRTSKDLKTATAALGTPGYMAPEAAKGSVSEVDEKSDVYSLGVILFELLTGRLPFSFETYAEFLTGLLTQDAPRADAKESEVPAALADIVARALERDRGARLPSVLDLSETIRTWQSQSAAEREAARLIDEARVHLGAATELKGLDLLRQADHAAVLVRRVLESQPEHVGASLLEQRISELRSRGVREREAASRRRLLRIGSGAAALLLAALGFLLMEWRVERERAAEGEWWSLVNEARASRLSNAAGQRVRTLELLREAAALRPDPILREELLACIPLTDLARQAKWTHESGYMLAVDSQFERYAWGLDNGDILVGDVATGRRLMTLTHDGTKQHWTLSFSPDGRYLATRYGDGETRPLVVWDLSTQRIVFTSEQEFVENAFAWHPRSNRVALGQLDGTILILDVPTGKVVANPRPLEAPRRLSFSRGGEWLAVATARGEAAVLDAKGRTVRQFGQQHGLTGRIHEIAWSPDDNALAFAGGNYNIYVFRWRNSGLGPWRILRGHSNVPTYMRWAHKGPHLISTGWDGTLRVWDPEAGALRLTLPLRASWMFISPNDDRIAFRVDASLEVWEFITPEAWQRVPLEYGRVDHLGFSPDSGTLASIERATATLHLWDVTGQTRLGLERSPPFRTCTGIQFVGDDLVIGTKAGLQWRRIARTGNRVELVAAAPKEAPAFGTVRWIDLTRSGAQAVVVTGDDRRHEPQDVFVWHLDTSTPPQRLKHRLASTASITPDGSLVATAYWRADWVRVWDARTGRMVAELKDARWPQPAFAADGKHLVIVDEQGLTSYRIGSWRRVARHSVASRHLGARAHPLEPWVATVDRLGRVHLFDAATLHELAVLETPDRAEATHVQFSPDGRFLALTRTGTLGIEVWDLRAIRGELRSLGLDWSPR